MIQRSASATAFPHASVMFLLSLLFATSSCKQTPRVKSFRTFDESFSSSNFIITNNTSTLLKSLDDRLLDPLSVNRAKKWVAVANMIHRLSAKLIKYIDGLKSGLKKNAGLEPKAAMTDEDRDPVIDFFKKKEVSDSFFYKLTYYKRDVLTVDQAINQTFYDNILTDQYFSEPQTEEKIFPEIGSAQVAVSFVLAKLTKLQTDILVAENRMINFCCDKAGYQEADFYTYTAIIAQNTSCVLPGEEIEITAGVGAFNKASSPQIVINNKEVAPENHGAAIYKLKAQSKSGSYSIPVQISFTDEFGNKQVVDKKIKYRVMKAD